MASGSVESETLRGYLSEKLPGYLVPSKLVLLEFLPLTANGKVDRSSLESIPLGSGRSTGSGGRPRGSLERAIASVWSAVLRVASVGMEENFFDLGGHSLLIVQVQDKLRRTLHRDIPVVDLFRYPTVRALAHHLTPDSTPDDAEANRDEIETIVAARRRTLRRTKRTSE